MCVVSFSPHFTFFVALFMITCAMEDVLSLPLLNVVYECERSSIVVHSGPSFGSTFITFKCIENTLNNDNMDTLDTHSPHPCRVPSPGDENVLCSISNNTNVATSDVLIGATYNNNNKQPINIRLPFINYTATNINTNQLAAVAAGEKKKEKEEHTTRHPNTKHTTTH